MKAFTISIPAGTPVRDPFAQEKTDHDQDLHIVAEDWKTAVTLAQACYATHIGKHAISDFEPKQDGENGKDLVDTIKRAQNVSGSIVIEGAVFVAGDEELTGYIYASENNKIRWIRLDDMHEALSPWVIIDALHEVF